jgi:hypothetical protein
VGQVYPAYGVGYPPEDPRGGSVTEAEDVVDDDLELPRKTKIAAFRRVRGNLAEGGVNIEYSRLSTWGSACDAQETV